MLTGLLATTTSCSLLGGRPSARDEAQDLARALSTGRLTGLAYTDGSAQDAQRLWTATVRGLGKDARPTVSVGKVTDGGDDAPSRAALAWSWALPGTDERWTYDTAVRLEPVDTAADWEVRLTPEVLHPELRSGEALDARSVPAVRADVLGAGGSTLVTARAVRRIGIDKTTIGAARQLASARRLARALGIDPTAYVAEVRAAGPRAFVEALVLRAPDAREALSRGGTRSIAGLAVLPDTLPLAPTRSFAREVLGTVGPVTAEMVEDSGGAYAPGDEAGLSGLEGRYDEQLRGTPGVSVDAVTAEGTRREVFAAEPEPGTPLRTTLAPRWQRAAEAALSSVGPASALVAVRPSTGDLLAVASGPGSAGYSTATVGQYAPGSTFKVVSSLALLRAGLRPGSRVTCPASTVVDGKRFGNYDDYPADGLGSITLATAVASSCNTAFVGQRSRVSQSDLAGAAASLGLGVDHDLGFPAYLGSVPATEAEAGSETGHAASMIGQGTVLASPLAMAAVAASVARGSVVVPRLLPAHEPADSTDSDRTETGTAEPATPLTGREAADLRELMRGVVTRGSAGFLASLPGPPVLAKTGTAEFGTAVPPRTHAWMIAVRGDLAVAVFVDVGASGSGTAGPVLERFLRATG